MYYTIRLSFQVVGTRRIIRTFIRPEYATNTSSHATRFDSMDAADAAADVLIPQMEATGRARFIGSDIFKIEG